MGVGSGKEIGDEPLCKCGDWFGIEFRELGEVKGIHVADRVPVRVCPSCKNTKIPTHVEALVSQAVKNAKRQKTQKCRINIRKRKFKLCQNLKVKYSSIDLEIIPGLKRLTGKVDGYYVPVFFNKDVLIKYAFQGGYSIVPIGTGGQINFGECSLDYGRNRHGDLFCWLGNLDKIPQNEQQYMLSENIESKHDIVSDLYKKTCFNIPVEDSDEQKLIKSMERLGHKSQMKFGTKICNLDEERHAVAEKMIRPVIWNEYMGGAVCDLAGICMDSINVKFQRGELDEDEVWKKRLCLLEDWISGKLAFDGKSTMRPFFVLYDWFMCLFGGYGEESDNILDSCYDRMGLKEHKGDAEKLYDRIVSEITQSYIQLAERIDAMDPVQANGTVRGSSQQKLVAG